MDITQQYFTCKKCGESKIWGEFKKAKTRKNGIDTLCKVCISERKRQSYDPQKVHEIYIKSLAAKGKVPREFRKMAGECNPHARGTKEYNSWIYARRRTAQLASLNKTRAELKKLTSDSRSAFLKQLFPNCIVSVVRGTHCDVRELHSNQFVVGVDRYSDSYIIVTVPNLSTILQDND